MGQPVKDALIVSLLSMAPRKTGARTMGWFARTGVSGLVTRAFVAAYGVDLDEATGDLADYPTLESLFTRELKADRRPIDADPDAIVSPVDGRVALVGTTRGGRIDVVPGKPIDVAELIGKDPPGECDIAVLYLSPKDYHRVHVPLEGQAVRWRYVPGTLWPVFPAAVRRVDHLFSKNERAVVHCETAAGPLDVVLVGAFGVGRITLEICDLITNTGGKAADEEVSTPLERGALLGTFHLGSTVVLCAPAGTWDWTVAAGDAVRFGNTIGKRGT